MLKRTLCTAEFTWELKCNGPLLIRDARYVPGNYGKAEQGYPQCLFMSRAPADRLEETARSCANRPPSDLPFFIPGTSLRGPFRSQAEKIIRTLCEGTAPPKTACDPFENDNSEYRCCSKRLEKLSDEALPYAQACPACRIFGCAGLASRISFTDADIAKGFISLYRDMIGIDRFTGAVKNGANMKLHILEKTDFSTTMTLINYELWHLGLLAYVFRDFEEGLVPIGFGKTKGFGQVKGKVKAIKLTFCRKPSGIEHLGSLMADAEERKKYGIQGVPSDPFNEFKSVSGGLGWRHAVEVKSESIGNFFSAMAPYFNSFLETFNKEAE